MLQCVVVACEKENLDRPGRGKEGSFFLPSLVCCTYEGGEKDGERSFAAAVAAPASSRVDKSPVRRGKRRRRGNKAKAPTWGPRMKQGEKKHGFIQLALRFSKSPRPLPSSRETKKFFFPGCFRLGTLLVLVKNGRACNA